METGHLPVHPIRLHESKCISAVSGDDAGVGIFTEEEFIEEGVECV